jgi:hypothetical protein
MSISAVHTIRKYSFMTGVHTLYIYLRQFASAAANTDAMTAYGF